MTPRIDYTKTSPDAVQAILGLEQYVAKRADIDPGLLHLLKIRASQINGCAFCVDMHVKEARAAGHGEQWLALIDVWRESPLFSDRERAVLKWVESVTLVSEHGAPDSDFTELRAHFTPNEIVDLTVAIGTINVWNRLAVAMRVPHPIEH
ncbi:MAG: carboxymuconolactone decarboxylase family protein [Pseudomonadota bacterium]